MQAIILAAGMVEVNGKTMIERALTALDQYGLFKIMKTEEAVL